MALGSEGSSSYSYLLLCGVSRTSMTLLLHTRNLTSAVTEQREPCRVGGGGDQDAVVGITCFLLRWSIFLEVILWNVNSGRRSYYRPNGKICADHACSVCGSVSG